MRRREFIAGLGAGAAWPLVARAQERGLPTIGWLHSSRESQNYILALHRGLAETGFAEGRNVIIEHRWPKGDAPALAAELVRRQVAVIVVITTGLTAVAEAATQTIPIVFLTGGDPVASGLSMTIIVKRSSRLSRSSKVWDFQNEQIAQLCQLPIFR